MKRKPLGLVNTNLLHPSIVERELLPRVGVGCIHQVLVGAVEVLALGENNTWVCQERLQCVADMSKGIEVARVANPGQEIILQGAIQRPGIVLRGRWPDIFTGTHWLGVLERQWSAFDLDILYTRVGAAHTRSEELSIIEFNRCLDITVTVVAEFDKVG